MADPVPEPESAPTARGFTRRRFLVTAAGAGATAVIGGIGGGLLVAGTRADPAASAPGASTVVPFDGVHQAGILRPAIPQPNSLIAAFDVVATSRAGLETGLRELTTRGRLLAAGWSPDVGDPLDPPEESGVLGASTGPAGLTVTVGVGASVFDERFGLGAARPRQLTTMPHFPNDKLDPDLSHGDLLVQVCATDELATVRALRYLMLGTRDILRLRWMVNGFHRPNATSTPGHTTTRNLMGFKDGTANPNPDDTPLMDRLVWIDDADGEPAWGTGGSYMVVRLIRMFVEPWDRTALLEQEKIIGRTKRTGAPLGGDREDEIPAYASDPDGARIPLYAHIRRANPRTAESERNLIFRRGYSYSRGFDDAGHLDQGLLFVCFQRDLEAGFVTVQKRLAGEPLEEYVRPVGGGYFYALPGVTDPNGFLGEGLLRA
jgi:deferrochelatase/peroxidase EfeB